MDCNEYQKRVGADSDGELDLVRHLEMEAHARECPACGQAAEHARAMSAALRDALPRYAASDHLADRIRSQLRPGEAPHGPVPARATILAWPLWNVLGLAASLTLVALGGFAWGGAHERRNALLGEAVSDHVRSMQANHLLDVVSTDQHTVRPWFAGKIDFSPPVVDLAAEGFPLGGGRLEHLEGRPAAALVFHRRQHAINLFIWPAQENVSFGHAAQDGYNARAWSQSGLNFLAVSEIPAAELDQFVADFRSRAP